MNADGRREGDVTDVMRVIGTECARLARMYHASPLTRTMLLQNPGRYDESSRGRTVVVEAGGLPWQPADHPYVIVRTVIQPLIPAPFGAQPHFIHPSVRRREQRDDVGEFLRRSQDRCRIDLLLLSMWCRPLAQVVYLLDCIGSLPAEPSQTSPGTDAGLSTDTTGKRWSISDELWRRRFRNI